MMKYIKLGFLITILITLMLSCSDVTSPELGDVPANLDLTFISSNHVKITWLYSNITGDTISFHIARKVGLEDWDETFDYVDGDTYEYIDDTIDTSTNSVYAYKIRFYNLSSATYSNYSEVVAYFSELTIPTELVITHESQTTLILTWTDNCIGEDGYRIDKKIGNNGWNNKFLESPEDSFTITDDNVSLFDTLYYRIYAFTGESESDMIQDSIFQTLSTPDSLNANILADDKIRLNWRDNSDLEEGFYIDRKVGESDWDEDYADVDSNETTFIDDILFPCATLTYRVRAYQDSFYSNYSNTDTINVNLAIIGELATNGNALDVSMSGWTAFVADNYFGLAVIDCFNPNNPLSITSYNLADRTLSSHIEQNFAYVATHSGTTSPGMIYKLDITDLENPVVVDYTNLQGIPKDIYVTGDYAYVAEGENGLTIIYTAGSNLFQVSSNSMFDAKSIFVENNYAFVADGLQGMKIFDILDPNNPVLISELSTSGSMTDIHVMGNYAFVADSENGMKIISISNIYSPYEVSEIETEGFVKGVWAETDYAYIVDRDKGFFAIDISDPYDPEIMGNIEMDSEPISIYVAGSYAYVTDNEGLKIIQVKP